MKSLPSRECDRIILQVAELQGRYLYGNEIYRRLDVARIALHQAYSAMLAQEGKNGN